LNAPVLSRRQLLEGAGLLVIGFSLSAIDPAQAATAGIDQGPRPVEPENPPKCLRHSADLPCVHTRTWRRASVPPIIELGADIKSP
jgi:hypothetical protein